MEVAKAVAPPTANPVTELNSWAASAWGSLSKLSWGSIVDTVVKQTEVVVDVYKRDISEFVSVVAAESSASADALSSSLSVTASDSPEARSRSSMSNNLSQSAVTIDPVETVTSTVTRAVANLELLADNAENFLERVTSGFGTLLSNAVVLTAPEEQQSPAGKRRILFDRKSASVAAARQDPATFLIDPLILSPNAPPSAQERADRFSEFKDQFKMTEYSSQVARLLDEDKELERLMERIVPSQVSPEDFWIRYFFKVAEVVREEETRKRLMQDASLMEDEFKWDSDEDEVEPSPSKAAQLPPALAPNATEGSASSSQALLPPRLEKLTSTGGESVYTDSSFEVVNSQKPDSRTSLESDVVQVKTNEVAETSAQDWEEWE
ncbi:hypothetical protein DFJ73DRAFT_811166 [Zopfochytrium polystomum]|nr:hypothetical protein DFJ73DRAFT_811166 [Zopfochytrium polystomum]